VPPVSVQKGLGVLNRWDFLVVLLVLGLLVFLAEASRGLTQPLANLASSPTSLDPANLPWYAARTTLRMLAAMLLSLLFTFTYATWAARSRRAELVLVPLAETLQMLRFAEIEGGDIRLTEAGKRFAAAALDEAKALFRRHLLNYVPLAAHIRRVLDERESHTRRRAPARS